MPAAILVTQTIVRKSGEHFRLRHWRSFTFCETGTHELVCQRQVQPVDAVWIRVEGDAVWITQISQVSRNVLKTPGGGIELIENVNYALFVVGEVEHVRDEDATIRTLRHAAYAFQSFGGDADTILFRKVKRKRSSTFAFSKCDAIGREFPSWRAGL